MEKHCDDSLLLRRLDGELAQREAAAVDAHLSQCWRCRSRRARLEQQIADVAACFDQCEFPEDWTERGLRRLKRSMPVAAPVSNRRGLARVGGLLLAAGLLAAGVHYVRGGDALPQERRPAQRVMRDLPMSKPEPVVRARAVLPKAVSLPAVAEKVTLAPTPMASPRTPLLHVEVLYALHAAYADLGEPISVQRREDTILVEGIVDTRVRLGQLRAALAELHAGPLLDIRLRAAEELPLLPPSQPLLTIEPASAKPAIEPLLESWGMRFPSQMAQSAVTLSSAALDHAWALRRLQLAIPDEAQEELPAAGRWLLRDIREEHREKIRAYGQSLESLLAPVLGRVTSVPAPVAGSTFERTALLRELIHSLFAGRQAPAGYDGPEPMLAMLKALLAAD